MSYLKTLTVIAIFVGGSMAIAQDHRPLPPTFPRASNATQTPGSPTISDPATASQSVPPVQDVGPTAPGLVPSNSGIFSGPGNTQISGRFYNQNPLAGFGNHRTSKRERELNKKIREFIEAVRGAADTQSEANATRDLRGSLAELFDERVKRRENEIDALKKRLQELQTKNEERKKKKDEIVDLKLKSIVNEAKGFGF